MVGVIAPITLIIPGLKQLCAQTSSAATLQRSSRASTRWSKQRKEAGSWTNENWRRPLSLWTPLGRRALRASLPKRWPKSCAPLGAKPQVSLRKRTPVDYFEPLAYHSFEFPDD